MSNSNTITTIVILGIAGIAGYFFYEKYIKKPVSPNLPSLGNGTGNFFQNVSNDVSNFLSQVSQPNSALTQSGLLNNTGLQETNQILSNPYAFNNLMMQADLNSLFNNSPSSTNSNNTDYAYNNLTPGGNFSTLKFMGNLNNDVTSNIRSLF